MSALSVCNLLMSEMWCGIVGYAVGAFTDTRGVRGVCSGENGRKCRKIR